MAQPTSITFIEEKGQYVCSLTIERATRIHIENSGGLTSFHIKIAGATRYDEIRNSSRNSNTINELIQDVVYPFDLQIRCTTRPSLALKQEEDE